LLPRLTGVLSIRTFAEKLSKTVGMYSPGKAFVVYEIRRQVFPTAPSPTTTHFIGYKSVKIKFTKTTSKKAKRNSPAF